MATQPTITVIGRGLTILGEVRNGGDVEVRGMVHGKLTGGRVVIQPGGAVVGELEAQSAEVYGMLDGRIRVRDLIRIGNGGLVKGDVYYGTLALSDGGDLVANVRNIPPNLAGDFEVVVRRGRNVRITVADLAAVDPDDGAESLIYEITNATHGHIVRKGAWSVPINGFSQADIEHGEIFFAHDGTTAGDAGFDACVTDSAGNTSGAAQRVTVTVVDD
ncbi:MAG: polymer-forming cytoskeletal protein [Hyphomicrobiaceae bacterium]